MKVGIDGRLDPIEAPLAAKTLGATGCARVHDMFLVALQGNPSHILLLDRDLREIDLRKIDNASDLHGIVATESSVYMASTGTNKIIECDLDLRFIRVLNPDDMLIDRDHINDLCIVENKILGCRFGPIQRNSLRNGSIFNIYTGDVLFDALNEPHSLQWADDRIYVLDSGTGTLVRIEPDLPSKKVLTITGYARGLSITQDLIAVGRSIHRDVGRLNNFQHTSRYFASGAGPEEYREAGIFLVNRRDDTMCFISMKDFGQEIYQIHALD